jgi:hypothetical protein
VVREYMSRLANTFGMERTDLKDCKDTRNMVLRKACLQEEEAWVY